MTHTNQPYRALIIIADDWAEPFKDLDGNSTNHRIRERTDDLAQILSQDGRISAHVLYFREISNDIKYDLLMIYESGDVATLADAFEFPFNDIARRTFILSAQDRLSVIPMIERTGGPGCIEWHQFLAWRTPSFENHSPDSIFGRKNIGVSIGASWESDILWESESYAMLSHDLYPKLPELLVTYLAEICSWLNNPRDSNP